MRQISYVTGYIFKVIGKYTHVHMNITIGGVAKIPHKQIIIKKKQLEDAHKTTQHTCNT